MTLEARLAQLGAVLDQLGSVCIGYSGGVDSAFLAAFAADRMGRARVLAVTGVSPAVPAAQLESARTVATRFGIPHLEVATNELADPNYSANPSNRCYYCKAELWRVLAGLAESRGLDALADGTNADDVADYRPGARAGAEWRVRSPLLEAGLTKSDIRVASRAHGLPTWDQPSSPCLASRLPYGHAVTVERLQSIEQAERALRGYGFRDFRVRHHGPAARIEIAPQEWHRVEPLLRDIARTVRTAGFHRVLLDVEGYRRGALNESVSLVQLESVR